MSDLKEKHEKRMKLWDASISSHQKWIDENTGVFADEYVEERACPVCNSVDSAFMFNKEGGTYKKCKKCSMVYVSPVFKDKYLNEYYASNHTVQSETVQSDWDFYNSIYAKGLDMAAPYYKSGSILDIGCSAGLFLDLAKTYGFNTFGVELNKAESEIAKKKHKLFECEILDIDKEEMFDLVTMWDVFEHIKDGERMLNDIALKLERGGAVFLQIPSSGSLAARVLQSKCNMFDGLEHVNLYNKQTIYKMAEKCGYEVIGFDTVISEASVVANFMNYEDPYVGTFNSDFLPFKEDYIFQNDLGYKIQVLMRKL